MSFRKPAKLFSEDAPLALFSKRYRLMPKTTLPVSNELRETLRWATGRLREIYGPRLKRLILFGSQARGEAEPESDVDVLVVLEGPTGAYEEARRTSPVATKAAAYRDTALSFVHMSEEEFGRGRSPLVWSVREDGIDLLELFPKGASPEEASSGSTVPESIPKPKPESTSDSSNR